MFMANLSSADLVSDEAGPSYDSDILSEVHDHDHYQDAVCEHHEAHEMHDDVQPNCIVDSDTDYTAQSVSANKQNKVVNTSLTDELATYKEQVKLYKRRAKFELTKREQKIEEQLRIVITNRNIKEENLKKELHSIKIQLTSTINHNKSMVEEKKVAIGYKNPLCLTHAKQVQPALYNGHEIIKTNHVLAIVHNSEDTLEIVEITRKKMNDKMKTPLWTEQNDVLKMKAEALKEHTPASRPIKALTVYPPNTLAMLVPRVLPTKRSMMRLSKKNILIANDNLIADYLSKEVFYIATNSKLTVSGFTEMHDAHTVVQARCLDLKQSFLNYMIRALDIQITQLTKQVTVLQEQNELFKAENAKIKQHYKELYDSIKITRAKHIKQTTALLTEKENLKAQIHENLKCNTMDSIKPKVLAPGRYAIDVEPIPPRNKNTREVYLDYLKHLKESVKTFWEIVEEAKIDRPLDRSLASACLYTKHS
ncbi:hypothetical protein Tco_1187301 [Tanacetum coccineum]